MSNPALYGLRFIALYALRALWFSALYALRALWFSALYALRALWFNAQPTNTFYTEFSFSSNRPSYVLIVFNMSKIVFLASLSRIGVRRPVSKNSIQPTAKIFVLLIFFFLLFGLSQTWLQRTGFNECFRTILVVMV